MKKKEREREKKERRGRIRELDGMVVVKRRKRILLEFIELVKERSNSENVRMDQDAWLRLN